MMNVYFLEVKLYHQLLCIYICMYIYIYIIIRSQVNYYTFRKDGTAFIIEQCTEPSTDVTFKI